MNNSGSIISRFNIFIFIKKKYYNDVQQLLCYNEIYTNVQRFQV
jgi:hypothetical protein